MRKEVVVFFVRSFRGREQVLLARKSPKAKVAEGKWNGYGGGVEKGETTRHACVRETDEESDHGLILREWNLERRGSIIFHNPLGKGDRRVHFYICRRFSGKAKSTDEMRKPTWFDVEKVDTLDMMTADRLFVLRILKGQKIKVGLVRFGEGYRILSTYFVFG